MSTSKKKPIASPDEFEGMTLMRMVTRNIKNVRYIDVTLHDTLTLIGGDNEQGKTSFLDSFGVCMGGKLAADMKPIRNGQQEGFVQCDFGDGNQVKLTVKRTLMRLGDSDFTSEVDVEIPGHVAPSGIETFLRKLTGTYAFDPMEFDELTDEGRFDRLQQLIANFDFKKNAAARKKIFDRRTEVNRDARREQSTADSLLIRTDPPCELVDEAALTLELQEAGTKNAERATRQAARQQATEWIVGSRPVVDGIEQTILEAIEKSEQIRDASIATYQRQIDELQKAIENSRALCRETIERESKKIRDQAADIAAKIADLEKRLADAGELPEEIPTAEISERLTKAREDNAKHAAWKQMRDRKKEHQKLADEHAAEADELSKQIDDLDAAKTKAIEDAKLPVRGIGLGDGLVTLQATDGSGPIPWAQASEAARMDTSLSLAMAMNPKLKVILIRNGSNIGKRIRQRIQERAAEKGYRVILEVVEEGEGTHVVIENGEVKARHGEAA